MATHNLGLNQVFPIYDGNGGSFLGLELKKSTVESVVMSLADKITGDVYYDGNDMPVTMREYIVYNGVKYGLVNPPTIVRNGLVSDNSVEKGLSKYTFVFYHPMYQLSNLPFRDVAVSFDDNRYLSEKKTFSWIGYPEDFKNKLDKNLEGTWWKVELSGSVTSDKLHELSSVIPFDENTIADALKAWYDTWSLPFIVDQVNEGESGYSEGKRFKVVLGYPNNEIYAYHRGHLTDIPYVFKMGQGVGLKNNSRTPRNNKIVTRISGYGSEDNIPYGYPQIEWRGDPTWEYTIDNDGDNPLSYPIYKGIVNGRYVNLIKHPFTRTHLMPSCYTESVARKVDPINEHYNPNVELVDYYDAIGDEYENQINPSAPSYESHAFEDVKPELGEERLVLAYPVDDNFEMVTEWDDTMDDDGNYVQSYFKVKLPRLRFDLYACAAITQSMKINMRSGACLGCTFEIQVDWDEYKENFYDADGNFAPDGEQRDYDKYPDSSVDEIEVVLKKEIETFGTLMPNRYQVVKHNDQFVVLGISLPVSYIENAEERLDDEMKAYMKLNNIYYFDFPLKFDEAFLRQNTEILSQIRPNAIVRFMFAGTELELFIKQLSIKFGDSPLPQYDITLTDNIEVATSPLGKVNDSVDKLAALIAQTQNGGYGGSGDGSGSADKLSRVVDDEAHGVIGFIKGAWFGTRQWFIDRFGDAVLKTVTAREEVLSDRFITSNYTDDSMFGTGGLFQYLNGKAKLVTDMIVCRGKFIVNEIEDRIWTYSGGNLIFSAAGSTIFYVEYLDANDEALGYTFINSPWLLKKVPLLAGVVAWSKRKKIQRTLTNEEKSRVVKFRCYETSDDGTMQTRNWWHLDDIAMCQTLNRVKDKTVTSGGYSGALSNTVYLRRVIGIGSKRIDSIDIDRKIYDYVDLSLTDCDPDYNDWPAAGDVIVQRGNKTDEERQGFSTLEVTGQRRGLHVYDDVNDYTMEGKGKAFLGYNADKKLGELEVYGDCYIGAYGNPRPHDGSTYIRFDSARKKLEIKAEIDMSSTFDGVAVEEYMNSLIHDVTDAIQTQVDQKAETWYQEEDPSTAWTTAEERSEHIGDLWHSTSDNKTYYYSASGWVEQPIPNDVFDTIDGKASVYINQPSSYKAKDLWILSAQTTLNGITYKKGELLTSSSDSNTFVASHWSKKVIYTDDDAFLTWKAQTYANDLTNLGSRISNAQDTANSANNAAGNAQNSANNAQSTADEAARQAAAAKSAADALDYVKTALKEHTTVSGGLILTTLIGLRSGSTTYGGINGAYKTGSTIAAWFGGGMVDRKQSDGTYSNSGATSLFRMDGSGYFAGGKINWDATGNAKFDGTITATAGSIGGFEIGSKTLGSTTVTWEDGYILLDRKGLIVAKSGYANSPTLDIHEGALLRTGGSTVGSIEAYPNKNKVQISSDMIELGTNGADSASNNAIRIQSNIPYYHDGNSYTRIGQRRFVSGTLTLGYCDLTVLASGNVTLPSGNYSGQHVVVINTTTTGLKITGNINGSSRSININYNYEINEFYWSGSTWISGYLNRN